jgi:hypothetical protein
VHCPELRGTREVEHEAMPKVVCMLNVTGLELGFSVSKPEGDTLREKGVEMKDAPWWRA